MGQKKGKKDKFEPKDLVLAKMHGFPAWPSFVMPLSLVPDQILRAKKKTTNFCVIFIPDGDFYWMNEKSLEALSDGLLDKKLEKIPASKQAKKKTTGRTLHVNDALLAARGLDFDDFMKRLDMNRAGGDDDDEDEEDDEEILDAKVKDEEEEEDADGLEADIDEPEEEEIEEEEEEEDDELEEEDESISGRRARSLKRRATSTPQPLPKRRTKSEQPKTPPSNGDSSNHKRTLTSASSESSPKGTTNEEKQHQLWLCRIKLQRTLIQRNQPATPSDPKKFPPPTVDELLVARLILNKLADFPMTVDFLKSTKIHKVLKCIIRDRDLEYSDSFRLHEKCEELLSKWSTIIEKLRNEKYNNDKKLGKIEKSISNNDDSEVSGIDTSLPLKNLNSKEVIDGISAKT